HYLHAMYLTAQAAGPGHWGWCVDQMRGWPARFQQHPKVTQLLLTAVYAGTAPTDAAIDYALELAHHRLAVDPADPVAHYRMVSLHRLAGDVEQAHTWLAQAMHVVGQITDPGLADHLRERLINERLVL